MLRHFLIDLTPLRTSADFRRLFAAQSVSMMGSQLTVVGVAFQVYSLTGSSLQVGAVSLAQLGPFVAGALAGGALGELADRRRILVVISSSLAFCSAGLAVNALPGAHGSVVVIYVVTALAAGLSGVVSTLATAAVPSLVPTDALSGAYATMQVIDQVGMVVGPAMGGVMIAAAGLPWLYGVDTLTFLWAAASLRQMDTTMRGSSSTTRHPRSVRSVLEGARHPRSVHSVLEGVRYLRGRPVLQGAYLVDLCATVFGVPRAVFPALALTVFHGGASTLGALYAAPAAGALVGSVTSGWLGSIRRQGRSVLVAVGTWGAAITVFGFARALWIALVLLVIAGWADVISAVLRSTIVQTTVHEAFRSRVSSLQTAVVEGGPRLGTLEAGAVATAYSPQLSVVSGGVACIVGTLVLAVLLPKFRDHRRGSGGSTVLPR